MTTRNEFDAIEDQLPWGFHDALLVRLEIESMGRETLLTCPAFGRRGALSLFGHRWNAVHHELELIAGPTVRIGSRSR